MATLIFTAIGTALGGPVGGALGALAGQALDARIFKPKGRTGPRLEDLSVQISRYGARIPRLFGTMRVAGAVIWSTDLIEQSSTSSSGKGQPSLTSFSYSASFAVALSSRSIKRIGRIWADGNLLRGAAGDLKAPVGAMRVHTGEPGQAVDPLIASAIGIGQAPAFRGLAYLVLEDLLLADFGNRIPSLTVEVIADEGAVAISDIAGDLSGLAVAFSGEQEPNFLGFAADGDDVGSALAPLTDACRLLWRDLAEVATLVSPSGSSWPLSKAEQVCRSAGRDEDLTEERRQPLETIPARLSVRHFDPARDYQPGVQSALRPGPGVRSDELPVPASLSADSALALAQNHLWGLLTGRRVLSRSCGWRGLEIPIGDVVSVEGAPGQWVLEALEWQDMVPRLTLRALSSGPAVAAGSAASGSAVPAPDLVQGPTRIAMIELPSTDDRLAETPSLRVAAAGETNGWRRAALFRFSSSTEIADPMGSTAPPAILGSAETALEPGRAWTFDERLTVDVQLHNSSDLLDDASDEAMLQGANLCALGREWLQFGRAEPIGPGRYRLGRLLRGWHGTEWAMAGHMTGEDFVMADPARLADFAAAASDVGQIVQARAIGIGDSEPAEAQLQVEGMAMLPPSPVHGDISPSADDLVVRWIRRSRLGWTWRDNDASPLGEERERYSVQVRAGANLLRETYVDAPEWLYPAAARASDLDLAGVDPLRLEIRQVGTHGSSRPLTLSPA